MNKQRLGHILYPLVIAVMSVALLFGALGQQATNARAETVVASNNVLMVAGNNVTANVVGPAVVSVGFGTGDCYSTVAGNLAAATQTITSSFQHSSDGINWVNGSTIPMQIVTGTSFTRTLLYGYYTRATITVSNTNPITASVICVLKDTTGNSP